MNEYDVPAPESLAQPVDDEQDCYVRLLNQWQGKKKAAALQESERQVLAIRQRKECRLRAAYRVVSVLYNLVIGGLAVIGVFAIVATIV